jgi:protein TonB
MMPTIHLVPDREARPELYRWGFSLGVVLLAHVVATAGFLRWDSFAMPPEPELAGAVMVELAPAPAAPESEPVETPPEPEQVKAEPPPEPLPVPEVEPQPQQAVLPPPAPEEPERDMVFDTPPEPAPLTTAPASTSAPPDQRAAAPMAGVSAQDADPVKTWQAMLLAQLELHKRYPRQAQLRHQEGVAYLRFVVDHEGRVVNYKLERSSGNASLDQESLALLQRAQPLPPPPPEMSQDMIPLLVPIKFNIAR